MAEHGAPPLVETWAFSPHDRMGYAREKDHLALFDADQTLCGRAVNPNGYPNKQPFDPRANYSCKRCVAALNKRGPFVCVSRISYSSEPTRTVLEGSRPDA